MKGTWASTAETAGFRLVFRLLTALPRRLALRVGAAAGTLLYWIDVKDRHIGLKNLAIALPERSPEEHRRILRASCRNLGRVGAEFCHLPELRAPDVFRFVELDDRRAWERMVERSRDGGVIIVTGHFGNWEMLAYVNGLLEAPVTIVYRKMRNSAVDAMIERVRRGAGTALAAKKDAARAALRTLRDDRILVIPSDQNQTPAQGVFVDFFGLPACTSSGAARLALRTGAPIIPAFLVRQGESERHRLVVQPEIEVSPTGDREADVRAITQRCSDAIENMLRQYPEQWIWFHRRWKTRPPGEPPVYS